MPNNTNLIQLIDRWLTYIKKNNISSPEDTDLSEFLVSNGFDREIFQPLIDALPEITDVPPEEYEYLESDKIQILNRIKKIIKTDMNHDQRRSLRRQLEHD